ncbi:MAG: DUF4232 domain-containing protein [Acidimicrobiales bacterium]
MIRRVGASALLVVLGLSGISYVAPAAASSLSRCQETQIDVDIVSRGAALGNVGDAIVITNVSSSACTVTGYPTVRFTGGPGVAASVARKTLNGYIGGLGAPGTKLPLPVVTLRAHGGVASSLIEGDDNPVGNARSCVRYTKVSVSLPHLSPPYRIATRFPGCVRPQVHPLVKGSDGDSLQ